MKKIQNDPDNYTLASLIEDPDFILWVAAPTAKSDLYWNTLLDTHPHLGSLIAQARAFIVLMKFERKHMDSVVHAKLWREIAQATTGQPTKMPFSIRVRTMAAAILAFAVFGMGFYFYVNRQIEIESGYGQTRRLFLPDSSEVILNANSSIIYANSLGEKGEREVWLKGEAFFNVKHLHRYGRIENKDLFLVHAGKIDVKVLGTTFNVSDRRAKVKVALLSGKVSVEVVGGSNKELIMNPGEVMSYDQGKAVILSEFGSADAKASWKDGVLIFEQLSVKELFDQLEDSYGYKAVFTNLAVGQKRISGTFTARDFDKLLKGLGMALGISILKKEDTRELIIR